ncbi:MAG TPA: hypothetical protein ENN45_01405, partial [Bacteroidetes bacterium]|nr:hypothetical protein [Bacteroidota bacterium]
MQNKHFVLFEANPNHVSLISAWIHIFEHLDVDAVVVCTPQVKKGIGEIVEGKNQNIKFEISNHYSYLVFMWLLKGVFGKYHYIFLSAHQYIHVYLLSLLFKLPYSLTIHNVNTWFSDQKDEILVDRLKYM